jgi:WD40 repeat protein
MGTNYPCYRLAATWSGHSDAVRCVAFSPAGDRAASASRDDTLRIWNVATGETIDSLTGHSGSVADCSFLPSSELLASDSADGSVRLWSIPREHSANL